VHVRFERTGETALVNRVRGLDHLFGRFFQESDTLGVVRVGALAASPSHAAWFATLHADTATVADVARYRQYMARPADKALVLTMEATGLPFFMRQIMQLDSIFFTPVDMMMTFTVQR
jgi:hypothetical protein